MKITENLEAVKQELSNDESLLTSVFRLEAWFRKYRIWILAFLFLIFSVVVGFGISNYLREKKAIETTEIFDAMMENGINKEELKKLAGGQLYDFILLKEAMKAGDQKILEKLSSSGNPFVAKVATYELASLKKKFGAFTNYEGFENLVLLQEEYQLILDGKTKEAMEKLNAIPLDAKLRDLALRIGHYGF